MTTDFDSLNRTFGCDGQIVFKAGPGGLAVAEVSNVHGTAVIALQGAHVMTWAPRNEVPVIYIPAVQEIPVFLRDVAQPGDSVITLGAGNVWQVGEQFLELESKRPGPAV